MAAEDAHAHAHVATLFHLPVEISRVQEAACGAAVSVAHLASSNTQYRMEKGTVGLMEAHTLYVWTCARLEVFGK
jgi:hypothetical protein